MTLIAGRRSFARQDFSPLAGKFLHRQRQVGGESHQDHRRSGLNII